MHFIALLGGSLLGVNNIMTPETKIGVFGYRMMNKLVIILGRTG
jgi:hypothetical protein